MNKLTWMVLVFLFPALVFADGSLSLAPPAGDYSIIFLGNLFGIVDGVLHGSGSQIMATMFGVFNSAVLTVGGIIIMYTLMVSTMNTAHEGQMLGQKWSSIWIPVRSTLGLAVLIPKASGYCLMQTFVMWIVVQGVGAADRVWEAALGYLNRGGVIIQAQAVNPSDALTKTAATGISVAGRDILAGQVCMLGLQKQLTAQRQSLLDASKGSNGPCSSGTYQTLCNNVVPDFIGSVNTVAIQNLNKTGSSFQASMPNFDNTSPYAFLNGICGTIKWQGITNFSNAAPAEGATTSVGGINNITSTDYQTAQMSRAIAIQQLYIDLSAIAQVMVNNDPQIAPPPGGSVSIVTNNPTATQQFGIPYTASGTSCANYGQTCTTWGATSAVTSGVLFNGTEFQGAMTDYNGIMQPTLSLLAQAQNAQSANDSRAFIAEASSRGWMMAGAYFFDLVKLNGSALNNTDMVDSGSGLESSVFSASPLTSSFPKGGGACNKGSGGSPDYSALCNWFNQDPSKLAVVASLIDGSLISSPSIKQPDMKSDPNRALIDGAGASTVYGFINNSMMMTLPGQPGLQPLQFASIMSFTVDTSGMQLQWMDFDCGGVTIVFFKFCLGWMFGNLFYNIIFLSIYNIFITLFQQIINQVIMSFLMIPLQGMSTIFKSGLAAISQPGVNPIVALANMGVMYINFAGNLWIMLLGISVSAAIIPVFGLFIFALISLAMPLLFAWVGIMVSIGFTTAYYIPILPYMIFTFGTIGWLITVIEAMVAAPIVALGITHPEGHDAFGKGEAAIMILMNVFLRPAMMIIGYISAIALSYVGVWILNAGYDHAIGFIQAGGSAASSTSNLNSASTLDAYGAAYQGLQGGSTSDAACNAKLMGQGLSQAYGGSYTADPACTPQGSGNGPTKYTEWAGIYAFFFSILTYTTMYLTLVQKSFTLISYLPDKVLRWIGGSPETTGQESAQWGEEVKQASSNAAKETQNAQGQMDKQLGSYGQKAVGGMKSAMGQGTGGGGDVQAQATQSKKGLPEG